VADLVRPQAPVEVPVVEYLSGLLSEDDAKNPRAEAHVEHRLELGEPLASFRPARSNGSRTLLAAKRIVAGSDRPPPVNFERSRLRWVRIGNRGRNRAQPSQGRSQGERKDACAPAHEGRRVRRTSGCDAHGRRGRDVRGQSEQRPKVRRHDQVRGRDVRDRRAGSRGEDGEGRLRLHRRRDQQEGRHPGRQEEVQGRDRLLRRRLQREHLGAAVREADQRGQGELPARPVLERRDARDQHGRREVQDSDGRRARGEPGDLRPGLQVRLRHAEHGRPVLGAVLPDAEGDQGESAEDGGDHVRERPLPAGVRGRGREEREEVRVRGRLQAELPEPDLRLRAAAFRRGREEAGHHAHGRLHARHDRARPPGGPAASGDPGVDVLARTDGARLPRLRRPRRRVPDGADSVGGQLQPDPEGRDLRLDGKGVLEGVLQSNGLPARLPPAAVVGGARGLLQGPQAGGLARPPEGPERDREDEAPELLRQRLLQQPRRGELQVDGRRPGPGRQARGRLAGEVRPAQADLPGAGAIGTVTPARPARGRPGVDHCRWSTSSS
jgi:hypothetical protein